LETARQEGELDVEGRFLDLVRRLQRRWTLVLEHVHAVRPKIIEDLVIDMQSAVAVVDDMLSRVLENVVQTSAGIL
jgi:hypothetical protein